MFNQQPQKNMYPTFKNAAGIGSGMGYESTPPIQNIQQPMDPNTNIIQSPPIDPILLRLLQSQSS